MDDRELLSQYVSSGSQVAFGELVRRNVDAVYSSARRQLRDEHLAEDVTQAVFFLLAKKAASVRGTVISWLITTTYYACRNARKLVVRRKIHERRAAEMKSESAAAEPKAWDAYAGILDEALARLSGKEQDAVGLRFLRGMSMAEVGSALGISEEAARKRINRGVERLRGIMSAKTAVPAAAALGAELAANATQAAPVGLGQTILASAAGFGQGAAGGLIAGKTAQTMALLKVKIAAMIVVGLLVLGTGTGAVVEWISSPAIQAKAASPVGGTPPNISTASMQTAPEIAEVDLPGTIQLTRWDLVLNDAAADAVRGALRPVATVSRFYRGYVGNAADIRRALLPQVQRGGVLHDSDGGIVAQGNQQIGNVQAGELSLQFGGFNIGNIDENQPISVEAAQRSSSTPPFYAAGQIVITDENHLHVNFNFDPLDVRFYEKNYQLIAWPANAAQPAIHFSGELAAGQALAMVGRITDRRGRVFNHLIVWETFKAQPRQVAVIGNETDCLWWATRGPEQLRRWADAARYWSAKAVGDETLAVPGAMAKKLSDGKILWLEAISRPAKWPGCWWDTQGKPSVDMGYVPFHGYPPDGLWFRVLLTGTAEEAWLQQPNADQPAPASNDVMNWQFSDVHQEGDQTTQLTVGVPVGPWQEIARLQVGEPQTIDGVRFLLERTPDPDEIGYELDEKGLLNDQYNLVAVDASGKESRSFPDPTFTWPKYGRDELSTETQVNFWYSSGPPRVYYRLMRRERQFVTFDHFATDPAVTPRTDVTTKEADQAEEDRQEHQLAAERKAWAAVPRDPKTPTGILAILSDDIDRGDEKAVRRLMRSSDPQVNKFLDEAVHLIILDHAIRQKAIARFGVVAIDNQSGHNPFMADPGAALASLANMPWKPAADGKGFVQGSFGLELLHKNADGSLYFDFDWISTSPQFGKMKLLAMQIYFQGMIVNGEKLSRLLDANPPPTFEQFKSFLGTTPAGPPVL